MSAIITALAVDYIADWNARLNGRLYQQFRDEASWVAWCALLARQFQDLEDARQTLFTLPSIPLSFGVQLDTIGRIVGRPRAGADDATYRLYLSAQIIANKSGGSVEKLYAVLVALYGVDVGLIYNFGGTKQFELIIDAPITPVQASVGASFIAIAKDAGGRAVFRWQEYPSAQTFTYGQCALLSVTALIGDTVVNVDSTAGFPASGSLILTEGTDLTETVTYTINSATQFATSALVYRHGTGHAARLVGDAGAGYPVSTTLIGQANVGDSSLPVDSTFALAHFPANGSIVVDQCLANEETIVVIGYLFQSSLLYAHSIGASVTLVGTGGRYSNAVSA